MLQEPAVNSVKRGLCAEVCPFRPIAYVSDYIASSARAEKSSACTFPRGPSPRYPQETRCPDVYDLASRIRPQMLEDFDYDAAHCYGVHGCCAIQMWRGEVASHHVPLMEKRWLQLIEARGSLAMLVVILPLAPTPSGARRNEIKKVYERLANQIKAIGTVIEDQGIKGTAGAMAMTTIMLMSKTPYPFKNGTHVEPIAAWLCEHVEGTKPRSLVASVDQMRRQFADISTREGGAPPVTRLKTGSR
jgi:hypothetical protein